MLSLLMVLFALQSAPKTVQIFIEPIKAADEMSQSRFLLMFKEEFLKLKTVTLTADAKKADFVLTAIVESATAARSAASGSPNGSFDSSAADVQSASVSIELKEPGENGKTVAVSNKHVTGSTSIYALKTDANHMAITQALNDLKKKMKWK